MIFCAKAVLNKQRQKMSIRDFSRCRIKGDAQPEIIVLDREELAENPAVSVLKPYHYNTIV